MPIEWTRERALAWDGDSCEEREVRAAARWRLRAISDRSEHRAGGAPRADFDVIFDADFELRVRPHGDLGPYDRHADGAGAALEILGDITDGLAHETTVVVRPADLTSARWHCSCGVGSRGVLSPDLAREAADAHATEASDKKARPRDLAVAQGPDGRWSQQPISVARRFRACLRSDFSVVPVHRKGHGEDFEVVVDGRLDLWLRRLGADAALRKDESARGVSLLVLEVI